MRSTRARLVPLVAVAVLVLLGAACSSDDDETSTAGTTADSPTTTSPDDEATTTTLPMLTDMGTMLGTAETGLGTIVVDPDRFTVYLFEQDTGSDSTCLDACAEAWPPVLTVAEPSRDVPLEGEMGTTTRPDGAMQVTYAGHPLYLFAGDTAPGDTNGQGVGGVWWVVGPDGEAIKG
jgi:predicted lipoprotein with Yx(FWY)xxD motif